jgi:acyl carrier protein
VLQCANRAAGTSLSLPPDGDIALEAFGFDSLSIFAFLMELERACGVKLDRILQDQERLHSIKSTADIIDAGSANSPTTGRSG